jgi:hypothetical protein
MYAIYEEKLREIAVNNHENTWDAQTIYADLKLHTMQSAAHISGDSLLTYVTSACFPGKWQGTAYAFVLHWKEQVSQYEKLEL